MITFEEATARWVQRHLRGLDPNPLLGTVSFNPELDDREDELGIKVRWQEEHEFPGPLTSSPRRNDVRQQMVVMRKRIVDKSHFVGDVELTVIIREIVKLSAEA